MSAREDRRTRGRHTAVTTDDGALRDGAAPDASAGLPPRPVQVLPSATITAEIPAVAGHRRRGGGPRKAMRSGPRRSAPYVLRLTVWLLFFVLLLALGGAAVEHYHPTWLESLRYHPPGAPTGNVSVTAPGTSSSTSSTASPSAFSKLTSSAHGSSYALSSATYSLVLTITAPCYVVIASPAGSSHDAFAQTVQPSASPKSFAVSGSTSLVIAARATSIAVEIGGKTVGTISAPLVGSIYSFLPRGT